MMIEINRKIEEQKRKLDRLKEKVNDFTRDIQQEKNVIYYDFKKFITDSNTNISNTVLAEVQKELEEGLKNKYENIIKEKQAIIHEMKNEIKNISEKYFQLNSTIENKLSEMNIFLRSKDNNIEELRNKVKKLEEENNYLKDRYNNFLLKNKDLNISHSENVIYEVTERFKLISQIIFNLNRNFRNSIGIIKESLNDLIVSQKDSNIVEKLRLINNEFEKVNNFLNVVKNSFLIKDLNIDIVDLKVVVSEIIKRNEDIFKENNIKINFHDNQERLIVKADFDMLSDIINDIIINAIEALTGCESPSISIELINDKINTILKIADNGDGIPEHLLGKVFDAFFTTKLDGKHFGLGLFKCFWFLKIFNAEIKIESTFKKGTEVVLTFKNERE